MVARPLSHSKMDQLAQTDGSSCGHDRNNDFADVESGRYAMMYDVGQSPYDFHAQGYTHQPPCHGVFPEGSMHMWNMLPHTVPDGGSPVTSPNGLHYTVAPHVLGFNETESNYVNGLSEGTANGAVWPGYHGSFPSSPSRTPELHQHNGVAEPGPCEQHLIGGYQNPSQEEQPQQQQQQQQHSGSYTDAFQEPSPTTQNSHLNWMSQHGYGIGMEQQISNDPRPKERESHGRQSIEVKSDDRPSENMAKRGELSPRGENKPQVGLTKKRGRKAKQPKVNTDPLTPPSSTCEPKQQRPLYTTSPASYATQSSLEQSSDMSSITACAATSFSSNTTVPEAFVETRPMGFSMSSDVLEGNYSQSPYMPVQTTFYHPSSSIAATSPQPLLTPLSSTSSTTPLYHPREQHQQQMPSSPYYHQHQLPRPRASSFGTPHPTFTHPPFLNTESRRNSTPSVVNLARPSDRRTRNRAAANKCRVKTKAAVTRLEEEEKAASERHSELTRTVSCLKDEVYVLRNHLLMHTDCDCTMIHKYLENTARDLANGVKNNSSSSSLAQEKRKPKKLSVSSSEEDEDGEGETDEEQLEIKPKIRRKTSSCQQESSPSSSPEMMTGIVFREFSNPATKVAAMQEVGRRAEKQRLMHLARANAMLGMTSPLLVNRVSAGYF